MKIQKRGLLRSGIITGADKEGQPLHTFAVCAYKDSPYLEACIRSLTEQVTIAHQDDVYRSDYTKELYQAFAKYPDMSVFVSDYMTLKMTERGMKTECFNKVWLVKKILRMPLRLKLLSGLRPVKRSSVIFGNSLCCPACTYQKELAGEEMFRSRYDFALDWDNLYELAGQKGRFICVEKPLIAYRVHEGATTKACIEDNRRTKDEMAMFEKMWPGWLVKILMHFYVKAYDEYGNS